MRYYKKTKTTLLHGDLNSYRIFERGVSDCIYSGTHTTFSRCNESQAAGMGYVEITEKEFDEYMKNRKESKV